MSGPHDQLFRYTFAPPARAEALLRHNLPPALTAAVDWSTLRRESGTLVERSRETRRDLLFSARYRHSAPAEPPHLFLVEHQSAPERWMALRMHDYCGGLVHHWRDLHPHSPWLPVVTPLVVYPRHGRAWSAPLRLEEHYRIPGGETADWRHAPWVLCFEYLLDDLSILSEAEILARPGPPLVPLTLLVLRFAGTEELAWRLPHWRELFARVHASARGPQMLYRTVRYLHSLGDERVHEPIERVLHSIMQPQRAEEFMRTMADVLREQGRQRGLAEGEARGEARGKAQGMGQAVLRLLEARGVRVDERSRQHILSCSDVATAELWLERALHATHLSEVLDGPLQ